jgi:hypothetical protein
MKLAPNLLMTLAIALLSSGALSGCARIRILRTASSAERAAKESRVEQNQSSAVFGLVDLKKPLVLSRVCPESWEILDTRETGIQILQNVVTLSIYRPWTAAVACVSEQPSTPPANF